MKSKSCLTPS